jgi:NAD(P)-dependent dehydrogenase (short-subunit alcohol dehydrogenase family)
MNQVFFVTGSSRGLGRQIAEQALAVGHRVVATARNPRDLDDLATRYGDSVHVEQLDVTDPAAAQCAVENGPARREAVSSEGVPMRARPDGKPLSFTVTHGQRDTSPDLG